MLTWCTFSDYHSCWAGTNWSGSNFVTVSGDQGETGFPLNGSGFGVYTSYLCGSGPAWEDGGSRLTNELVNFRIIMNKRRGRKTTRDMDAYSAGHKCSIITSGFSLQSAVCTVRAPRMRVVILLVLCIN